MHRRGGKRIRMDDPPPEYVNPMTPATPMTDYGGQSVHEPETPNVNFSAFNVVANSTAVEPPREEDDSHHEEDDLRSPSPAPTKRVTRSRGRGGDGGYVGRLAESPPPPPLRPRRGRGGRGRGRGRGAPPPPSYSPPPMLLPGDDENSLYNILRFNKTAINQVVDMWIEQYKSNREHALVQLMQFFINSSGCRGKVSPDMAQMDHTLIIKKMTQEFDEESGEYPLIMSGQTWKKFRANFCEFIQTLVKMCQYSIIYDQYLMDNIISLLTGLSDSQVRAFRHTATLAVMKLMTALVDVALLTSVNCDNCLRQYEAERLKARDKRASERLEVLVAKRQELEENMEEIKNMLSYMFKSVFVHRYRDTLPDIRAITMAEIGIWMEKFPAHFLDDLYLKYIGWTLHDKVGEVRLRCLQALQPLYECEELKGKLELFTSKFKDRIVAMSLDKETDVAVHAVRLVIAILKMHPDVLTDKDCENVYELVYSSNRLVAAAAGEFLNVRLFRAEPPPSASSASSAPRTPPRSRRGKERLPNTPLIRDLVQFFIESELHEHGAYLVDSLIESNPMMKDWECMTDLLLEEPGPGEEALDNRQESSLIELMVCCVRQAASGEPPVGRGAARKHAAAPSKDQAKIVAEDRAKLTQHFLAVLPALLDKFGADPDKLANLVSIPVHFERSLYCTSRQEAALGQLLARLRDIVATHTEAEVLETAGRTLEHLCDAEGAAARQCAVARATITDMCVNRYKEAIDDYRSLQQGGEEPDADETFNVVNSLRKVSIMYMCHDLNDTNIWDSLFEDLPKCLKTNEMPAQALVYVVRCLFYSVLWSLHALEERVAAGGGGGGGGGGAGGASLEAGAAALRERLTAYSSLCKEIVAKSPEPVLREEAYTSLCDLLIYFAETPGGGGARAAPLKPLVLEPDAELCDLLNDFIQEFVFVQHNYDGQDERRIEELHKRRNFLAAYCKLIVYNVTPIRRAADVFKHYIKCYNDYGDIIKATLSKAREINKLSCALTMQLAMQALYSSMLQKHAQPHRQLPELLELKELAKRFSVMFGLDAVKNREALTALHRAGVAFAALEPRHLLFLEPLAELSNKLLRQDKRHVLKFLDARISAGASWGEEWAPLQTYRGSLLTDATDERPPPPARRHYARRNRGQDAEEEGEENHDSEGEPAGIKPRRRLRLSVSHRRTSLPRLRRASRTPTPASTPRDPSIDESTPPVATPLRRRRRFARPFEFQDSDISSPSKYSDISDAPIRQANGPGSKYDDKRSPSKESYASRKELSKGAFRRDTDSSRFQKSSPSKNSDTSDAPIRQANVPGSKYDDKWSPSIESDASRKELSKGAVQRDSDSSRSQKSSPSKNSDTSDAPIRQANVPGSKYDDKRSPSIESDASRKELSKGAVQRASDSSRFQKSSSSKNSDSSDAPIRQANVTGSPSKDIDAPRKESSKGLVTRKKLIDLRRGSDSSRVGNSPSKDSQTSDVPVNNVTGSSKVVDKSPSQESDTSREETIETRVSKGARKNVNRIESDNSESEKQTSLSKEDSDTSRKDSTSGSRAWNVTLRNNRRRNYTTECHDEITSRSKNFVTDKTAKEALSERYESGSSEEFQNVTSYSNYDSGASRNDSNITAIGKAKTMEHGDEKNTWNTQFDPSEILKKIRSQLNDGSQKDQTLTSANGTVRGQKRYAEKENDAPSPKRRSLCSGDSPKGSLPDMAAKANVTIRGRNWCTDSHTDDLDTKLRNLFWEECDSIARGGNDTPSNPRTINDEKSLADESNKNYDLPASKEVNATIRSPKSSEGIPSGNSSKTEDNTSTSPDRTAQNFDQCVAPAKRRPGIAVYRQNVSNIDTARRNESVISDTSAVRPAPAKPRQGVRSTIATLINDIPLGDSSKPEDNTSTSPNRTAQNFDQCIGPAKRRPGIVVYNQSVIADTSAVAPAPAKPRQRVRSIIATTINDSLEGCVEFEHSVGNVGSVVRRCGVAASTGVVEVSELDGISRASAGRGRGRRRGRRCAIMSSEVAPPAGRPRRDSGGSSPDEREGGPMLVHADVHRPSTPQQSGGSLPMSLTPPASDPRFME